MVAKVCQDGITVIAEGRERDGRKNQSRRTIRIHIPGKKHVARLSGEAGAALQTWVVETKYLVKGI